MFRGRFQGDQSCGGEKARSDQLRGVRSWRSFFSANTASVTDVFEIIAHMKKTAPIQQFQVIHKVLRNSSISSAYRFTEVFAIDRFVVPI